MRTKTLLSIPQAITTTNNADFHFAPSVDIGSFKKSFSETKAPTEVRFVALRLKGHKMITGRGTFYCKISPFFGDFSVFDIKTNHFLCLFILYIIHYLIIGSKVFEIKF